MTDVKDCLYDVFISYADSDRTSDGKLVARQICDALEEAGIICWIATRDIATGEIFAEAIVKSISESKVTLLIFSENAKESPFVLGEVNEAVSQKKPVVTFIIEPVKDDDKWRLYLNTSQKYPAYPDYNEKIDGLISAVKRILGKDNIPICFHPYEDCQLYVSGELKAELSGGVSTVVNIPKGRRSLEFISLVDSSRVIRLKRSFEEKDKDTQISIVFPDRKRMTRIFKSGKRLAMAFTVLAIIALAVFFLINTERVAGMDFIGNDGTSYTYTGRTFIGLPFGEGKAVWKDGREYEGGFRKGLRHDDDAFFKFATGDIYEGVWRNDHMTEGKITYMTGAYKGIVYEGTICDDKAYTGEFHYPDGDVRKIINGSLQ